jgi:hypothetical protein
MKDQRNIAERPRLDVEHVDIVTPNASSSTTTMATKPKSDVKVLKGKEGK